MANAKCSICGKEYDVCGVCLSQKSFRPWRTITDTMEHYKIYLAIHSYTLTKDKEAARTALKSCDLSELETFNPEIKSAIRKIQEESW